VHDGRDPRITLVHASRVACDLRKFTRRRAGAPRLTARQWELLRLVAAGHSNADIARQLFLSENTVRKHLENIYQRLSVSSRTAAVALAFQSGYPT